MRSPISDRCQKGGCLCPSLAKSKYCGPHALDALGECPIKGCSRLPQSDRFIFCQPCADHYMAWAKVNQEEPSALRWLAEVGS